MHRSIPLICTALLAGSALAQDKTQAPPPKPLGFYWPLPVAARVTETIPGDGPVRIKFTYSIGMDREEGEGQALLRFSEFEIGQLGSSNLNDYQQAELAIATVPGLVTRPALQVDARGRAAGTTDYEVAARAMFSVLRRAAPGLTPEMRTKVENDWLGGSEARSLAVSRVQADWEAWVGAWIGLDPRKGEQVETIKLRLPGFEMSARSTVSVVPDESLGSEAIRVQWQTLADGSEAKRAMQKVMDAAEQERVARDGGNPRQRKVLRYVVEDRVEAVVDRGTLLPRYVRIRRVRELAIEGEATSKRIEDRRFDFEWRDVVR